MMLQIKLFFCVTILLLTACQSEKKAQVVSQKLNTKEKTENKVKEEVKYLLSEKELNWLESENKKTTSYASDFRVVTDSTVLTFPYGISCKILAKKDEFIRFKLDDVETAKLPFRQRNYREVLEQTSGREIFLMQEERENEKIVPVSGNVFAQTIYKAYQSHRPLELTPDAVWLIMMQGVALHLNNNIDFLNKVLLDTSSRKIVVRNDDLPELKSKDWVNLVNSFCDSIEKNVVPEFKSTFNPQFSTTKDFHRVAYNITLMNIVKSKYTFIGESGCGIPYITLKGTPEDWKNILNETEKLNALGLGFWVKEIKPILQQFYLTSQGKPNEAFWRGMVKEGRLYGPCLSGWFIKFFPYLETTVPDTNLLQSSHEDLKVKKGYKINPYMKGTDYMYACYDMDDIPESVLDVPVLWVNNFVRPIPENKNLLFHAGFVGMRQNTKTKELSSEIGWFITDTNGKSKKSKDDFFEIGGKDALYEHNSYSDPIYIHQKKSANTFFYRNLRSLPIYAYSENADFEIGMTKFKNKIFEKLKSQKITLNEPIILEFTVSSLGTISNFVVKSKSQNLKLSNSIKKLLMQDNQKWEPAYLKEVIHTNEKIYVGFRFQIILEADKKTSI